MKLPVRVAKALDRVGLLRVDGAPNFDKIAREHAKWSEECHARNLALAEAWPELGPAPPRSVDPGDYLRTFRDIGPKALEAIGAYAFSTWGTT